MDVLVALGCDRCLDIRVVPATAKPCPTPDCDGVRELHVSGLAEYFLNRWADSHFGPVGVVGVMPVA